MLSVMTKTTKTCCYSLCWMDGAPPKRGHAIASGRKPTYDDCCEVSESLILNVGPPWGFRRPDGNSRSWAPEISARGAIVSHGITRIDLLIANKQLDQVPLFQQPWKPGAAPVHFLGLLERRRRALAHPNHLFAVAGDAKQWKVESFVHASGRPRHPANSGRTSSASCSRKCASWASAEIATVVGRYYARDRDNAGARRTGLSRTAHGEAETRAAILSRRFSSYEQGVTDDS